MKETEIYKKIVEALSTEFELDPLRINPEASLYEDLELDSLDAVDMVVVLEKTFEVRLANEQEIRSIRTIADLYQFISAQKVA